jgi:pimeloyl-ACP methyl ester carboxylesterase
MTRQYFHVGERTIAYFDSAPGNAAGNVVLLIHAFPLAASMWEAQFKALPSGWRLIAPDLRGFGGSTMDQEPEPPSIDDYADDVIALLGELDVPQAAIGGCSMGGYVTFAVLRKSPQLARAVLLVDTRAGADTPEGRANRRAMLAVVDREGAAGVVREMLPKLLGKTTHQERSDVESNVRRLIKQQAPAAIRGAVLRMMERPESYETLEAVKVPVLIVVGEEDTLTPPADSQKMADLLAQAELAVIARAGHLASLEQPDEFNRAFAGFLSRL